MNFNGGKHICESVRTPVQKNMCAKTIEKIIITKEEKKQECYHEIATDALKGSRAANDLASPRKAKKSTAQTEQPI
jgi:hypothetical protein